MCMWFSSLIFSKILYLGLVEVVGFRKFKEFIREFLGVIRFVIGY